MNDRPLRDSRSAGCGEGSETCKPDAVSCNKSASACNKSTALCNFSHGQDAWAQVRGADAGTRNRGTVTHNESAACRQDGRPQWDSADVKMRNRVIVTHNESAAACNSEEHRAGGYAAIYARQSIDRPDSISIESQIDFCRREIPPFETVREYLDRGFSGKNTDRPAFQKMMEDVERGEIRRVVVYKLDRISRSILDFSSMMERFEKRGVEFLSTTEKFDTSSPMGRAMLNICVVFAQLERETIQKRVADAYYSRSRKGFYMGGRVPFGFSLVSAEVSGVTTAKYVPVDKEARQISVIFSMYSRPYCSYGDIARFLNGNNMLKRGKAWVRTRIADILKNPVYVRADTRVYEYYVNRGAEIVNPPSDFIGTNGCYLYSDPGGGEFLVLAPHEGIIPAELWLKCRAKCDAAKQVAPPQKAKNTWLAGLIKCGVCGYALVEKHFPDRPERYFVCSNRANAGMCDGPGTLYADIYENAAERELKNRLCEFPVLKGKSSGDPDPEENVLTAEILTIDREINSLVSKISSGGDAMVKYISRRLDELDTKKTDLELRLKSLKSSRRSGAHDIMLRPEMWDILSFEDKRRVAALFCEKIVITAGKADVYWRF